MVARQMQRGIEQASILEQLQPEHALDHVRHGKRLQPGADIVHRGWCQQFGDRRADHLGCRKAQNVRAILGSITHHPLTADRDQTSKGLHASGHMNGLPVAIGQIDIVIPAIDGHAGTPAST